MDDDCCFVCTNELDATDTSINFCECELALCLWCWHRICEEAAKEDKPARCPNCRAEYDKERIQNQRLDPEQLEEVKRKQRKDERRKTGLPLRPRKDLANVRVVQRNLVYVVGLALELCHEDLLKTDKYFGQFGKIIKISTSRSGPYGTAAAKNGPTGSAYITYKNIVDARRCIETVHGEVWEGKSMKACYGTTKYCNAFLKGLPCNNVECLYLHDVAEDEDSYTKEETKTPRFVNLVHAASIQKQQGPQPTQPVQPVQPVTANGHTPRANTHASEDAFVQQSVEQLERSGLATSSLPEPLEQQGPPSGPAWPALGGSTWAAKALSPAAAQAPPPPPPPPPPPVGAVQEWPTLGGAASDATDSLSGAKTAGLPPVAAHLQRKGSTMAAEIARAASTPSGAAAGAAAAREPPKPAGPGTVLVVPKKKQSSPPLRTPKKLAAAPAVDAAATNGSHGGSSDESASATSAMPPAAAEAASKAVAAALRKGKPKHGSAGLADEQQLQEDGEQVQAQGPGMGTQQAQQAAGTDAAQSAPEQRAALHSRASEGALPVVSEAGAREPSDGAKVKSTKPPPGFESVNGVLKASTGAKKGPPPGFAGPAEQAQAMNGSTSPFPSFSSESSSVSAAQEALTAAINTPVPLPAAQKLNGSVHWDAPPPSSAASSACNIWGSGNNVHADPFLQQRAARSRSRFDFAQDDSQPSSNGHQGSGQTDSNLSFAAWANTSGGPGSAGRELLWQLQAGGQNSQSYGIFGGSQLTNGGSFGGFPAGQGGPGVGQYGQGAGQPQPPAALGGYGGYPQQHAAMQPSQQMTSQDLQWLDTAQRFQNMAV